MLFILLLAGCGVIAGITTILFGFGGGFLVVPLLYHSLLLQQVPSQAAMPVAVATSTCVMVVTASWATWRQARQGAVHWPAIRRLIGPLSLGAVLGAILATKADGDWLRWGFVSYLLVTVADSLTRRGFVRLAASPPAPACSRPLSLGVFGILIGGIAAALGVGGSVMTVPMMRRRGLPMNEAAATANPLTLPIALAATVTYALTEAPSDVSGPLGLGYIDIAAFIAIAAGSWIGIQLAMPWTQRIPDTLHARVYIGLLIVFTIVMAW
ncbi:sulfite exporter TauE/SafE family protein [Salinisphaera sp. T31B1]|uniref:sulfite exporter TauE/SafE family protein n=1 Tax=Salinisphaera sp. T31B1 TaxID=727963 RepID=UPI00333FCE5B